MQTVLQNTAQPEVIILPNNFKATKLTIKDFLNLVIAKEFEVCPIWGDTLQQDEKTIVCLKEFVEDVLYYIRLEGYGIKHVRETRVGRSIAIRVRRSLK